MVLKQERKGLEKKFYEIAAKVIAETDFVLYDLDYNNGGKTLRVFIMDPKTNTAVIDDCVAVDRGFTPFMEEADWIPDDIVLEVSSPGMFRSLNTIEHFKMAGSTPITLNLKKTLGDILEGSELDKKTAKAKTFVCNIEEVNEDNLVVALDEEFSLKINYIDIKKANLEPDAQAANRQEGE